MTMEMLSSPQLPTTSDIEYNDELNEYINTAILPSSTNSDELEAILQVQEESRQQKNKEGIVIQHRAWKIGDTFRSEADYIEVTPVKERPNQVLSIPSSPPSLKMPSASSPVAYPGSSSPPVPKRQRDAKPPPALKPKTMGGFIMDDESDEDEFAVVQPAAKRRTLEKDWSPSLTTEESIESQVDKEVSDGRTAVEQMVNKVFEEPSEPAVLNTDSLEQGLSASLFQRAEVPVLFSDRPAKTAEVVTCSGKKITIRQKPMHVAVPFEQLVAGRSTVKAGRARRSFYGIDVHQLMEDAAKEIEVEKTNKLKSAPEVLLSVEQPKTKAKKALMWTEKYRARHFMELCGDDRTHRQVLRWLKSWDPVVFPKSGKAKPAVSKRPGFEGDDEKAHKKILLLTGPPGLGKTTLAHVCARQAGYEVMEINASDERSSNVVKGRIRTSVGTESVKTGSTVTSKSGHVSKNAHPLCVVVDEVDGVVGGSGGSGEGGFVKALIDLVLLDQKNSSGVKTNSTYARKKKKGDDFKLMRPMVLICNDVYHSSLRPLRQSNFAEIIHVRKPPMDAVVTRMKSVFEKEGVQADGDAVRRLCEATWGVSATESRRGKEGTGEGDLRGIMVVGEWAAGKLKASIKNGIPRLTRNWVEQNMMGNLSHGGGGARGIGRGGPKEVVNRVFLEGAGFPRAPAPVNTLPEFASELPKTQLGVAELAKKAGMDRLREMVDTSGDIDRVMTDIFSQYPSQPFNDDSILSKPDSAYEWLHFHDTCSSRVFQIQEFELAPYLSQPVLACHHLFASPARHHFANTETTKKWGDKDEPEEEPLPFSGPRADYEAHEAIKSNRDVILSLQNNLNPTLLRSFRSPEDIAVEFLPYLVRMITPEVKPIIVGGSGDQKGIASVRKEGEKAMVKRAVDVMGDVGVIYERGKIEGTDFGSRASQWVYRMEPPLDELILFETATSTAGSAPPPVRYAVRQVLDQEYQKSLIVRENASRQARYKAGGNPDDDDSQFAIKSKDEKKFDVADVVVGAKKDFFGRVLREKEPLGEIDGNERREGDGGEKRKAEGKKDDNKVWVTFHEGFSNAVRKPITIEELLRGL